MEGKQIYNKAKPWELAFFAMNNSATNAYMFLMMYISYYATGIAGLGVAAIGIISTATRLWDGITDPIVGMFIDRTNGKFGKFRPFMVLGNIILAVMVLVIYGTTHLVPEGFRLIYYILCYLVYIIGYTFQTACTKAGQSCLTNDPAQRPQFALYNTIYSAIVWGGLPVIASGPLYTWAGGFTKEYFLGFCGITIALSGIMTVFSVIGIWSHDNEKYFGGKEEAPKYALSDYLDVIKHNRAIQMLIFSAASDSLAGMVKTNSVLMVVLFGIFMGNYSLYGTASGIVTIPSCIIALVGVAYAAKKGMRRVLINFSWLNLSLAGIMLITCVYSYSVGRFGAAMNPVLSIVFVAVYCLLYCSEALSGGIVIPMIADCADYEVVRSGRYVPGMMGTLFSFVDKFISSLATTIVAFGLVLIGYSEIQPVAEDPMTTPLFIFLLVMYFAAPMLGWIINLIAMKFYPLSKEKMAEIQEQIAEIKAETNAH